MTEDQLLCSWDCGCYKIWLWGEVEFGSFISCTHPTRMSSAVARPHAAGFALNTHVMHISSQFSRTGRSNAHARYYLRHRLLRPLCVCDRVRKRPRRVRESQTDSWPPRSQNVVRRTRVQIWRVPGGISDENLPRFSVSPPLVPSPFCQLGAPHPFLLTVTLQLTLQRIHQCL